MAEPQGIIEYVTDEMQPEKIGRKPAIFAMDADDFTIVPKLTSANQMTDMRTSLEALCVTGHIFAFLSTQRALDYCLSPEHLHSFLFPLQWEVDGEKYYSPAAFEKGMVLARLEKHQIKYPVPSSTIKFIENFRPGFDLRAYLAPEAEIYVSSVRSKVVLAVEEKFAKYFLPPGKAFPLLRWEDGKLVEASVEVGEGMIDALGVSDIKQAKEKIAEDIREILTELQLQDQAVVSVAGDVDILPKLTATTGKATAVLRIVDLLKHDPVFSHYFGVLDSTQTIAGDNSYVDLATLIVENAGLGTRYVVAPDKSNALLLFLAKMVKAKEIKAGDGQSLLRALKAIGDGYLGDERRNDPRIAQKHIKSVWNLIR
jgi:hypothetical protein